MQTTNSPQQEENNPPQSGSWLGIERRWLTLIAVCCSTFMLLVDVSIVQVALPAIQRYLHANFIDLQWVIDAYALTLATLMLAWGTMADRFGRKHVFVIGVCVFTIASFLCGISNSAPLLIWARALQGIGGAAMFATGLALIGQKFKGIERGKAIAAWGATVGAATAIGPVIGGGLTSGLSWRWIFFVNIPIGIATIWLSQTKMVNVSDSRTNRLDYRGLVTFAAAMFFLIYGLIRTNADSWTSTPIIFFFAASAISMTLFVIVELHHERPMFDLSLFRKPAFSGACLATFAIAGGMFAMYPYITLYLQNDLGFSPFAGGLRIMPSTIPSFLLPILFRSRAEKIAPRILLGVGIGITAVGLVLMVGIHTASHWEYLIPGLLVTGAGIGIANPAIARTALGVVSPERSGMASGISNTFRVAGLATGVAALGAIFQRHINSTLAANLGHPASQFAKLMTSTGIKAAIAATHAHASIAPPAHAAFVSGLKLIFVIGAIVVGIGAIIGAAMVRTKDFTHR